MTTQTIEIIKYPNDVLRQKALPIGKGDKEVLEQLQFARRYIMIEDNKAVGLALPQLGVLKRGFVATIKGTTEIIINPRILKKSGIDFDTEGCLSIDQEVTGMVPRPKSIMVQYYNHNWKPITKTLNGWDARVFSHELDHLNGILFIDHVKED